MTTNDDKRPTISEDRAAAVLYEYPDADLSGLRIVDAMGQEVSQEEVFDMPRVAGRLRELVARYAGEETDTPPDTSKANEGDRG